MLAYFLQEASKLTNKEFRTFIKPFDVQPASEQNAMKILKNKTIYTNILGMCFLCSLVACGTQNYPQIQGPSNTLDQNTQQDIYQPPTFMTQEVIEPIIQAHQHAGYFSLAAMFQDLKEGKKIKNLLDYAVAKNEVKFIEFLLQEGRININSAINNRGQTLLHLAVGQERTEIVELLLTHPQIDPNQGDMHGQTPLHLAVGKGQEQVLNILLRCKNIKTQVLDQNQQTPLGIIFRKTNEEFAKLFFAKQLELMNESDATFSHYNKICEALLIHSFLYE